MTKKNKTDLFMDCNCGSKAQVFEGRSGWYSHCPGCGKMTFWNNVVLTERLKYGGHVCPHNPEMKDCKNGSRTSFCKICRVRIFLPAEC
jgi:hypothetical protein